MLIIRQGTQGKIALALPLALADVAESIHDALGKAYPHATVRVIVNHCLAAEIIRAEQVDATYARSVVEALRAHVSDGAAPTTLQEAAAVCLGWALEEVQAYSLRAIRDLVQGRDAKLAASITREITPDPRHMGFCIVCQGEVFKADLVERDGQALHRACDAPDDATLKAVRFVFLMQPEIAWSHLDPRAYLERLEDSALRALAAQILPSLLPQ